MKEFKPNDRVKSRVMGYYYGLPGTIRGLSNVQYDNCLRYVIDLDIGKAITLKAWQIALINDREGTDNNGW